MLPKITKLEAKALAKYLDGEVLNDSEARAIKRIRDEIGRQLDMIEAKPRKNI